MKRMPKRNRSHQLEAESVRGFQSKLPLEWIYRTPSDDYGIDGEVEIFDKNGLATGQKFLVQLKATDQKDKAKALKLRLPIEKANYFETLNNPVLIVRYLSKNKKLYARWFHSFDPYLESIAKKSISFNFTIRDKWEETTPNKLLKELAAYFRILKGRNPFPLELPLFLTNDCILGTYISKFASKISLKIKKFPDICSIRISQPKDELPHSYILIDKEKLHVVLANKTGTCIHLPTEIRDDFLERMPNNLMVSIGLAFFHVGYPVQAGKIIYESIAKSDLKNDNKAISACIFGLIEAGQIEKCLNLSETLFSDENGIELAQLSYITIIRFYESISDADLDSISKALNRISESLIEKNMPDIAAVILYNHGNLLRAKKGNIKNALHNYKLASKHFPEYKERAYWLSEVAACLFLLDKFHFSSLYYEASLLKEDDNFVRALYADSLMFSGKYEKALEEFHKYFENVKDSSKIAEWRLKSLCLHVFLDELKIKTQIRKSDKCSLTDFDKMEEEEIVDHLKAYDALCPNAWFKLGIINADREEYSDSAISFMISAFSSGSFDAWGNAISCSMRIDVNLSAALLMCTFEKYGDHFYLDYFSKGTPKNKEDDIEMQIKLMEMMQEFKKALDKRNDFELRIHGFKGGYDSIRIKK